MRRRELIAVLGALICGEPDLVRAQASTARPTIVLLSITPMLPENLKAFLQGLEEVGVAENRDFDLVSRSADGDAAKIPDVISAAMALNPAVIVSQTTGLTVSAKRVTSSIPIVGNTITDPIGLGLITNFPRPGGNVTGTAAEAADPAKLLELLTQIVPGLARVGSLYNPANPGNIVGFEKFAHGAEKLSILVVPAKAASSTEIEPAFDALKRAKVEALMVAQDALFTTERERISTL